MTRVNIINLPQQSTAPPRLIAYVTTATACELLDVCESTLKDWVKLGYIPRPKRMPNGTLRWKWSEIEKALDGTGSGAAEDDDPILRASRGR